MGIWLWHWNQVQSSQWRGKKIPGEKISYKWCLLTAEYNRLVHRDLLKGHRKKRHSEVLWRLAHYGWVWLLWGEQNRCWQTNKCFSKIKLPFFQHWDLLNGILLIDASLLDIQWIFWISCFSNCIFQLLECIPSLPVILWYFLLIANCFATTPVLTCLSTISSVLYNIIK